MGLFDFLKKPRTDISTAVYKSGNPETGEGTSVFKGDLARFSETGSQEQPEAVKIVPAREVQAAATTMIEDSADSVVFMSFAPLKKDCWTCPECGTNNDERLNGCIVLRKFSLLN